MQITNWGLSFILVNNLGGMPIYEGLLSKITLDTNEDGNIKVNQIDNLKTSLKVAHRLAIEADNVASGKLKRALESLLEYGTEESSNDVRAYLSSPESKQMFIITPDSEHAHVVSVLSPYVKNTSKLSDAVPEMTTLLRQCKQIFV